MDGFKFTDDQKMALKLIGGAVKNLLLFGGSRSGKTLVLLFSIVLRAIKAPGSRMGRKHGAYGTYRSYGLRLGTGKTKNENNGKYGKYGKYGNNGKYVAGVSRECGMRRGCLK